MGGGGGWWSKVIFVSNPTELRLSWGCDNTFFGGVEEWRLKVTSAKVEVIVEAELSKIGLKVDQ